MKLKKLAAAMAVAGLAAAVHAQSTPELHQALARAQAAAEQAQDAARKAQAALLQVQAAAEAAKNQSPAAGVTMVTKGAPGTGLTISSGSSYATLYGLIDITYSQRSNATITGITVRGPQISWFSGNRWGLTGRHTLGSSDVGVIFKLESEFESQTGNMDTPGVLFNRDAWVGFESPTLGKLTFGRQDAIARDYASSGVYSDPYGSEKANLDEGGYTNTNNFKQLVYYAGSATGTRYDRGLVWKKEFGRVVAGLGFQFGATPGQFQNGTTKSGSLAYNGDNFTVAGFVTEANVANLQHKSASIGGNVRISPVVRLNAGYYHYTAQLPAALGQRKDSAWTMSAKIAPTSSYDFEFGYQIMDAKNAGLTGSGYVQNAFSDTSGVKAVATGKRKTLYASAIYHLDRVTELYVVGDRLNTTGTYHAAQANGFMSQTEFGLGMRYRF